DEPDPSAAELVGGDDAEPAPERLERPEGFIDGRPEGAGGRAAAAGSEDRPEQAVVGVATTVVADRRPGVLGDLVDVAQEILDRQLPERGIELLQGGVEAVHVS